MKIVLKMLEMFFLALRIYNMDFVQIIIELVRKLEIKNYPQIKYRSLFIITYFTKLYINNHK